MPERATSGTVSCIVNCMTCGWQYENHRNGLGVAGAHAKRTGHEVHAEVVNVVVWNAPKGERVK